MTEKDKGMEEKDRGLFAEKQMVRSLIVKDQ